MSFDEVLSAELPEPRDDEPENLRRDILDELADHLACSHRRELLSGADAESARRRAFERFGDPAAIAARLWLDAMKGRIMSQRILATACVLLAISCVALAGTSWFQWDRMNRAQSQQLAASQAMQNLMLKQMQALTKAVEHPRSPDWNPASFKLTEETPDGPPAVGLKVSFGKNETNSRPINRVSNEKGIVDLDAVQPGEYGFTITRSMDKKFYPMWSTSGSVQVKPYQDLVKSIVCPPAGLRRFPIRLQHERPEDLTGRGLVLHVGFYGLSRKLPDGVTWSFMGLEDGQELPPPSPLVTNGMVAGSHFPSPRLDFLIDLDGGKIERIRGMEPYYASDGSIRVKAGWTPNAPYPKLLGHVRAHFRHSDRVPIMGNFNVLEGDHPLSFLAILRPGGQTRSKDADGFDVVAIDWVGGAMATSYHGRPEWMPEPADNTFQEPLQFYAAAIQRVRRAPDQATIRSASMNHVNT